MNQREDRPRAEPSSSGPAVDDALVVRAVREYLALVEAGHKPDRGAFVANYPEIAGALAECLAGLDFVQAALPELSQPEANREVARSDGDLAPQGGTLGDFRIVREIGRGGMGIVYEAEQISLSRRVALKVLPFAATMDPRHLQRFQNEAKAAACLHHTNIVPVFSVGCERGVHFYAMQFIEGQSLAELIAAQRHNALSDGRQPPERTLGGLTPIAQETQPIAAAITQPASPDAANHRSIAQWGIQAAEALEHAHGLGIIHRDIKPSNLMIDDAGRLWVTDFGLARTVTDVGLTMTGDVVGTLRYMSPEQALAKHGLVDHRTDIYALGATLYELLTLRPAVDGKDREEILRNISFEEPSPPRSLGRTIPTDLETIVLKALAKEPGERYPTAQEMADDLSRFLKDRPVRARRPSWLQIARKWLRRHQSVAWAASVGLTIALIILSVCSVLLWQEKERVKLALTEKETQSRLAEEHAASAEKQRLRAEANFGKILNGLTMMLEHLDEREWPQPVRIEQVHQTMADQFVRCFQQLVAGNEDDPINQLEIGWVYQHLGHYYLRRSDHARSEKHFRKALAVHEALMNERSDDRSHVWMYAQSLYRLATVLCVAGRTEEAHDYYLRAREQYRRQLRIHPDSKAYNDLAWFLVGCPDVEVRDTNEAERLASRAVELSPNSDRYLRSLGSAQYRNGNWRAAVDTFQNCMRHTSTDEPYDCFFLAMADWKLGNREQARQSFDRGVKATMGKRYPFLTVQRARAEAAALLGISVQPTPKDTRDSAKSD